jgi:hypothetical protein
LPWHDVEPELVYPLLKGAGLARWTVRPDARVILTPHSASSGRQPLPLETLRLQFPRWHAWLHLPAIRCRLESRRARLRWGGHAPWHGLFEIGPYTFQRFKVGYRGQVSSDFAAAVFADLDVPLLGRRLLMPDQTVHFLAADNEDEAYYLAGVLNSSFVRALYRGFGYKHPSTFFVKALPLPTYVGDPTQCHVATLARLLTKTHANNGTMATLRRHELALDAAVARLLGLSAAAADACRSWLGSCRSDAAHVAIG